MTSFLDNFLYVGRKRAIKSEHLDYKTQPKEAIDCLDLIQPTFSSMLISLFFCDFFFAYFELEKRVYEQMTKKSLTPLLDNIVGGEIDYHANSLALVEKEEETSTMVTHQKKKQKSQELRLLLESLAYTAKLEARLREVESETHTKEKDELLQKLALREEALRLQEKELQLKNEENAFLKEKESFYQQQQPKKARARPPKKAKQPPTTTDIPENQLVIVPESLPPTPCQTGPDAAAIALLEQEQQRIEMENQARYQEYLTQDRLLHSNAIMVREKKSPGGTQTLFANIAISACHHYKLRVVLEQLFDTLDNEKNDPYQMLLDHPLFTEYRVLLGANIRSFPETENEEEQKKILAFVDQELFKKENAITRINMSVLLVHLWFLAKAVEYNSKQDRCYDITTLQNRPYQYHPEILHQWYPCLNTGIGCIITEDLKMPAHSITKGQGEGKCCCFCGMQFVAVSDGTIKHSHQLKYCDLLANLSNDEREIINVVLERRMIAARITATIKKALMTPADAAIVEFANDPFIATYTANSFLRLATPDEIAEDRFVICPQSGDRVRVNMVTLMRMRAKNWDKFTKRIGQLDTANDEKNLNSRPIAGLMDCFDLYAPRQKYKIHMNVIDGMLYKSLVDYNGNHYMTSKKIRSKIPEDQRSFAIDPLTGFGDGVRFSMPNDQLFATIQPLVFEDQSPVVVQEDTESNIVYQNEDARAEDVHHATEHTLKVELPNEENEYTFSASNTHQFNFHLFPNEENRDENHFVLSPEPNKMILNFEPDWS